MGPVKGNCAGPEMQCTTGPVKQVKPGKLEPVNEMGPGPNIKLRMVPADEMEPE